MIRLLEHPGDALVVLVPVRVEVRHGGGGRELGRANRGDGIRE